MRPSSTKSTLWHFEVLQIRKKKHLKEAHKITNKSSCLYSKPKTKKNESWSALPVVFFFFEI